MIAKRFEELQAHPRARGAVRSDVAGAAIEWEDGMARMGGVALVQIEERSNCESL